MLDELFCELLSLDVEYGTLLGYTYDETQKYFSGYLDNA